MTIGQNIKRLRKKTDMTQEELAELLSISSQAVSRWETGSAMPDISLLPALVNLFGVTSDELLGIDSSRVAERVDQYKREIRELYETHRYSEMLDLAREANQTMPNNMELVGQLAFALSSGENAAHAENIDNAISAYRWILEKSTDNTLRFRATAALCRLFAEKKNDKAQALFYAKQLPKGYIQTGSYLIGRYALLQDSQKEEYYRDCIEQYTKALTDAMYSLADPNHQNSTTTLTMDQKIALLHQILDISKMIYGDDLLSQSREFYELHRVIGCLYLSDNNIEKALDHLETAFSYAQEFEKYKDGACYSSLALLGVACDRHDLWSESALQDMQDRLTTQPCYDALKNQARFVRILQLLNHEFSNK